MAGTLASRRAANAPAISEGDLHLLPRNMRELVQVVGIPAFVLLVEDYGGGTALRVVVEATPDSCLWERIGPEAFRALVARYKGELIEIAKCDRVARELQRRAMRYDYFTLGLSQDSIAMNYGYTVRHVRNILYYISEHGEEKNLSLF